MKLITQKPKESFSDVLKKYKPINTDFDNFKTAIEDYFGKNNPKESEEHYKTNLRDFLLRAFYEKDFAINTKGKQDLAIHLGKKTTNNVGVIFETKKPSNKNEMITADNPNRRALHEIIYYYFDERADAKNFELKRLVVSDFENWFVFDSNTFDRHFYNHTEIRKLYENTVKENKGKVFFYGELAKIFDRSFEDIPCVHFDITAAKTQTELIEIYNALSPAFLLKAEIADDSNALNKPFYNELLHIIGLEETRDKSKIRIDRKPKEKRDAGSLLELAITKIETEYSIFPDQQKLKDFGETRDERIYNIALELCIVWINRILFLKLLEAQLVNYHHGDTDYRFLNIKKIRTFNELYKLFHEVLAKPFDERNAAIQKDYSKVPYLNSSLFEFADIERETIRISAIDDDIKLDFASRTALDTLSKKGEMLDTLEYLFRFLDHHDFASVEKDVELRDEDRPIINASVLGKIFEKINGYKDGSIYTPGFITMYMCRQSIRLAVVQKFNDKFEDWNVETFAGLRNKLARFDEPHKILEFNEIINGLKICDPAVGSGHFLVSALNEIIAVKHELGILADADGNRFNDYNVAVVNDELDITDSRNKPFKYEITNGRPNPSAHRFQKALFHEKQTLIENCLFGVDINPNSVKICRLRLWIELLKNAYYKFGVPKFGVPTSVGSPAKRGEKTNFSSSADEPTQETSAGETRRKPTEVGTPNFGTPDGETLNFTELETLPNIDINIKEGNSLISRFALDANLKDALKTIKYSVGDYRAKVFQYKNERRRDVKRELLDVIEQIKADFRTEIYKDHPKVKQLRKAEAELFTLQRQLILFEENAKELEKRKQTEKELTDKIAKLESEIEDIQNNKIYRNAFEWRFEFPEVLDDDGNFLGFDIVIGNPPYIRHEELGDLKNYLKPNYEVFTGTSDILVYFYELSLRIAKANASLSLITSNKFMRSGYGKPLREFLGNYRINEIIDFGDAPVFGGIAAYASIVNFEKKNALGKHLTEVYTFPVDEYVPDFETAYKTDKFSIAQERLSTDGWRLENPQVLDLLDKLRSKGKPLGEYVDGRFYRGVVTGLNEAFVIDGETRERLIAEDERSAEIIKPYIRGRDVKRWQIQSQDLWLCFVGWHFETENYPAIYNHLLNFEQKLKARPEVRAGKVPWFAMSRYAADYWQEFDKPKIILGRFMNKATFAFDREGFFNNDALYMIPDANEYVVSVLNSSTCWWFLTQICTDLQNGYLQAFRENLFEISIPEITPEAQKPFIEKVDEILELKKAGANTDVLEGEIDRMVYDLYELTPDEIAVVKGND